MENREEKLQILCDEAPGLLSWFAENRRELPFRKDRDPYRIYVSEIMLQQTRISTVIPYYLRFIEKYPDAASLARADEGELMKLWEGLGYYSRARNLKRTAEIVSDRYGGVLPRDYALLTGLPGIGSYTAGAILSLAYGERVPLADGNVLRVLSRFFGDDSDIGDAKTKRDAEAFLRAFLEASDVSSALFNESLMELGETLCIPNGAPCCGSCPLGERCRAHGEGRTSVLPVKLAKHKRKLTELTVFLMYRGEKLGIVKREGEGLLSGLYGLPVIEGRLELSEAEKRLREAGAELSEKPAELPRASHIFTHREWHMRAFSVKLKTELSALSGQEIIFVTREELCRQYALPGAFRKWELFPRSEET